MIPARLPGAEPVFAREVHVSTAYVARQRSGLIQETELDCGQAFWNTCEKSWFDLSNTRSIVPDYDSHFTPLDVPCLRKVIEFQRNKRHQT